MLFIFLTEKKMNQLWKFIVSYAVFMVKTSRLYKWFGIGQQCLLKAEKLFMMKSIMADQQLCTKPMLFMLCDVIDSDKWVMLGKIMILLPPNGKIAWKQAPEYGLAKI